MLDNIFVLLLPFAASILVGIINGEIQIADSNCPPHSWSTNALNGALECIECNKCNNFSSD